jgi:hypothetical protein
MWGAPSNSGDDPVSMILSASCSNKKLWVSIGMCDEVASYSFVLKPTPVALSSIPLWTVVNKGEVSADE